MDVSIKMGSASGIVSPVLQCINAYVFAFIFRCSLALRVL